VNQHERLRLAILRKQALAKTKGVRVFAVGIKACLIFITHGFGCKDSAAHGSRAVLKGKTMMIKKARQRFASTRHR